MSDGRNERHEHPPPPVTIRIGTEVHGRGEKLGEVSRVIVDADADVITHIVVKHGFPGLATERVVPVTAIGADSDGVLVLHMGQDEFNQMDGFDPQEYWTPTPTTRARRGSMRMPPGRQTCRWMRS